MLVVALDCTGETFSCGLLVDGSHLTTLAGLNPRTALKELPAHIGHLLQNAGGEYGDIVAVGVTQGPGSFTGVRLGVTLAKTIAFAAKCQIAPVDTLELIAYGQSRCFQHSPGSIGVALDARRKELYCALFENSNFVIEKRRSSASESLGPSKTGVGVRTPEEFASMLANCTDLRALIGPGFAAYPELIPADFRGPVLSELGHSMPPVDLLCHLTYERYRGLRLVKFQDVVPHYHRHADVQVSSGGPSKP